MPRLLLPVPKGIFDHLLLRLHEGRVDLADLQALRSWIRSEPVVPEGDWFKDFGSFKLAGTSEFPKIFLAGNMAAHGQEVF